MELPRYRSQTLPQVAAISPGQAGAGAAAMGEALARGLDVTAQVTAKIGETEAQLAAEAALAEIQADIRTFSADPRWQQPEIDGEPTSAVLEREWQKKQAEIIAKSPKTQWRTTRAQFDNRRKQILAEAGADIRGQQWKLQIDRTKGLADYTAEQRVMLGDWDGAQKILDDTLNAGAFSVTEYLERTQKLKLRRIEDGYLQRVAPGAPGGNLTQVVSEVLTRPDLPPERRRQLALTITRETERRERDATADRKAREEAMAPRVWANLEALSVADILATPDIPENERTAMVKIRRAMDLEGVDTPKGMAEGSEIIVQASANQMTRSEAVIEIQGLMQRQEISPQTARKFISEVNAGSSQAASDPLLGQMIRDGQQYINKGVPVESLLSSFERKEAAKRAAIAIEFARDFRRAAIDAQRKGEPFDPIQWSDEKLPGYLKRTESIPTESKYEYMRVPADQKMPASPTNMDREATKEVIRKRAEAERWTPAQVAEVYRELGLND